MRRERSKVVETSGGAGWRMCCSDVQRCHVSVLLDYAAVGLLWTPFSSRVCRPTFIHSDL